MECVIDVSSVSKKFRRTVALDDVSFQVPRGVVFALLGENGAGKTTLIRTMLGLEKQDSGTLKMLGMDPVKSSLPIRRCIGYVSDSPALYRWMTVKQIAHFTASFYDAGFLEVFHRLANHFDANRQSIRRDDVDGSASTHLANQQYRLWAAVVISTAELALDGVLYDYSAERVRAADLRGFMLAPWNRAYA